jgi:hypothetical protein
VSRDHKAYQFLEHFSKYSVKTNKKYVYYTAIFGDYDGLKKPDFYKSERHDFICFTDNKNLIKKNNGWRVILVDVYYRDPRRTAKIFKILNHYFIQGCEYSIWTDGKNELIKDFSPFIEKWKGVEFKAFPHPSRVCAYKEARVCVKEKKDLPEYLEPQMEKYRLSRFPENQGLLNGSLLIRNHQSKKVSLAMEAWWEEIDAHSVRDQLSLPYVLWKYEIETPEISEKSQDFIINYGHKKHLFYDQHGKPFSNKKNWTFIPMVLKKLKKLILK